jgi:dynein light intermediate chain
VEKREAERRQLDEKKRKEELEFLRHQGKHLDNFLKHIGSGK